MALWTLPAFFQSLDYFDFKTIYFAALAGGFIVYFFGQLSMDKEAKTSMQIIAHELTHSFFAVITFHSVKHIRVADDNSGGSMGFVGTGNWLIVIAPYFFPLFCFFFMLGVTIYLKVMPMNWIISVLFGYFVGYFVDTVASQIHDKQFSEISINNSIIDNLNNSFFPVLDKEIGEKIFGGGLLFELVGLGAVGSGLCYGDVFG